MTDDLSAIMLQWFESFGGKPEMFQNLSTHELMTMNLDSVQMYLRRLQSVASGDFAVVDHTTPLEMEKILGGLLGSTLSLFHVLGVAPKFALALRTIHDGDQDAQPQESVVELMTYLKKWTRAESKKRQKRNREKDREKNKEKSKTKTIHDVQIPENFPLEVVEMGSSFTNGFSIRGNANGSIVGEIGLEVSPDGHCLLIEEFGIDPAYDNPDNMIGLIKMVVDKIMKHKQFETLSIALYDDDEKKVQLWGSLLLPLGFVKTKEENSDFYNVAFSLSLK